MLTWSDESDSSGNREWMVPWKVHHRQLFQMKLTKLNAKNSTKYKSNYLKTNSKYEIQIIKLFKLCSRHNLQ